MVQLRSRGKAKAGAPRVVLKIKATVPKTSIATTTNDEDLSEAALRRLSRPELQKLAKAHNVKANMKSEVIIQQLSRLQVPKKARPAENDPEEGPSRKRSRRSVVSEEAVTLPSGNERAPQNTQPSHTETSAQDSHAADLVDPPMSGPGPSLPQSTPPVREAPTVLSYDRNLFSGTESEMTEEEQRDFDTPVSSRRETPPAANVNYLQRCVTIMRQISDQDVALLDKAADIREAAARLHRKARDVRDLVKAERGRRERMETYFRYWQETEPTWDRQWLYEEMANHDHESDGASTMPGERWQRPPRPIVPPDEVGRRKQAILAKQQADQRELEALI